MRQFLFAAIVILFSLPSAHAGRICPDFTDLPPDRLEQEVADLNDDLSFQSVASPASEAEVWAIEEYTGFNFRRINDFLRGVVKETNDSTRELIANLTSVISRARMPAGLVVYRGARYPKTAAAGTEFDDAGYTSTSLSPQIAFRFVVPDSYFDVIELPKEVPGILVAAYAVHFRDEREVLLQRGTRFQVIKSQVKDGYTCRHLRVLN